MTAVLAIIFLLAAECSKGKRRAAEIAEALTWAHRPNSEWIAR